MATLSSLLARDGVVSLEVIEQALQRQVLEGGEIDTALLELSNVPENVLGAYRAASYGLLPALRSDLEQADAALVSLLPAELAREHHVIPIAHEGSMLVLAGIWPLTEDALQELARHLKLEPTIRIATELRVRLALSQLYGQEPERRFELLAERLASEDAGAPHEVSPPLKRSEPPGRPPRRTSYDEPPATEEELARRAPPRGAFDSTAAHAAAAQLSAFRASASHEPSPSQLPPVRVVPMVRLDSARPSRVNPNAGEPPADETMPARPSAMLPPHARGSRHRAGRLSAAPRGPLTQQKAMDLLGNANDRDRVLDAFFSFARQYFACTVLFALRDERLLGLEASGLPALDVRALELPVAAAGNVQALVLERAPQVLDLSASPNDRALVHALGRAQAQPCSLIPISIRQRIVAVLYGDRGGEPIALPELTDLLQTLPAVSAAFERIIQSHKLQAVAAREQGQKAGAGAPRGSRASGPNLTPLGMVAVQGNNSAGAHSPSAPPPLVSSEATAAQIPRAARVPAELAASDLYQDDLVARPTVQLQAHEQPASPLSPSRAVLRPSQRPAGTYSVRPADAPERPHDQEATKPAQPSAFPGNRPDGAAARPLDPPPPRTLSNHPPGMGAYSVQPAGVERVSETKRPSSPAPQSQPEPQPPPSASHAPSPSFGPRDPRRQTTPRRKPRADARRDSSDQQPRAEEIISIPAAVRDSRRPASVAPTSHPSTDREVPASLVVDLAGEAARLVDELVRLGPEETPRVVAQLQQLGDAALPVLAQRFPGPLWFDRHKPRQRLPQGRELSAIARALHAFDDNAVSYLAELLTSSKAEARYCATLLCGDLVRPDLLWPLYQRLFDADGPVRLVAIETLPLYRNVSGFSEVLKTLRERAANEAEQVPARMAALDSLGNLRDAGSVEVLIKLCAHASRQLSVPAHRSLVSITGQDFEGERKWHAWLDKNRARHRVEWLIDGLMHTEERVRTSAGLELQKLTQVYYGFVPGAAKREREACQTRYRNWWVIEGKRTFGV